jgi:hypothetical protein
MHTPGPWEVYKSHSGNGHGIDGPKGGAVVWVGSSPIEGVNKLDDARLIAAAPELLGACRAAAYALRDANLIGTAKFVEAAIAKAEGRA